MKEQIKQVIRQSPDPRQARNLVREYCQARILQSLQEAGAYRFWIFHGGTALRFLHGLPRYSEDLDFALSPSPKSIDFQEIVSRVCRSFEAEAYNVESRKLREQPAVKSVFIAFPGLLFELGLSPHRTEALSIKIEYDSRPPGGGTTATSIIRRHVLLNVLHYDRASLLSGKIHAVLMRPYIKGRDLYDLLWYLSDPSWPPPNFGFLNEALRQTEWRGPEITGTNWIRLLAERLDGVDWPRAVEDVGPFIERPSELALLSKETFQKLFEAKTGCGGVFKGEPSLTKALLEERKPDRRRENRKDENILP